MRGGGALQLEETPRPATIEGVALRVEVWESVPADCPETKPIEMTGSAAEDGETTVLVARSRLQSSGYS